MRNNIHLKGNININFVISAFILSFVFFSKLATAQPLLGHVIAQTSSQTIANSEHAERNDSPLIVGASLNSPVDKINISSPISPVISGTQQNEVPMVGKHVGGNMDAMTMIVSLLLVLIMVVVFAFITKRFQPARLNSQGISLVTSMALSAKERIIVIQVGDKQQLLGVTAQQITLLDTLDEPLAINKPLTAELGQSFIGLLQKQFKKPKSEFNDS